MLSPLANAVRGSVQVTGSLFTLSGANTFIDLWFRPVGGTWTKNPNICNTQAVTSLTCPWNTVGLTDGQYEVQAHGKVEGSDSYDTQIVTVDNTAPTGVTISVPIGVLSGNVDLTATASDATSGVANVVFQYRSGSGAWTNCGADSTAPYSCRLNTSGLNNGASYSFQAVATDAAGNATTSASVTRTVDNTPATVSISSPAAGTIIDKTANIDVAAQSARGVTAVRIQTRAPGGNFTDLCTDTTAPYSCPWDATTLLAGTYDLRAVLSQTSGSDVVSDVRTVAVDHNPGTVTITSPAGGTTISHQNSVTVTGSTKSPSGVTAVTLKATPVNPSGTTTSTNCTLGNGTFSCAWDTSAIVYGSYELRAEMKQGNTVVVKTPSAVTVNVDNVTASVAANLNPAPASGYVKGTETLTATTSSNVNISSVRYDVSPASTNTWTAVCAVAPTVAPYSCAWDTLTKSNGSYDLRAVMTLANGATVTSSTVTVNVANLKAVDVQAGNQNGTVASGDTLTLTYSTKVDLASIKAGWTGGSTSVSMAFRDKTDAGAGTGMDRIDFTDANLGQVVFAQDYVAAGGVTMTGTMTAADVNGATVITVALGTLTGATKVATAAGAMTWTPSTAVKDFYLQGACAAGAVTESGAADSDF
ncbi:Ig-like domain-containing protein [Nocardioides koreensis]|uniref:Ig-like domain-containing protein n=1 Tax=Nocardioides koreensis TaxID=433651 RepID=UPI0031DDE13E